MMEMKKSKNRRMRDRGGDESLMWLLIRGRIRRLVDDKTAEKEEV